VQAAPARAVEWELPLGELRLLVANVASGKSDFKKHTSPGTIVSYGLEWRLQVEVKPKGDSPPPPPPPTAARPVQLGVYLRNSFRFVPTPPAACKLTGLSFRLEAARPGARLQPLRMESEQDDKASPDDGVGWRTFFPALAGGSVDDPALAPFVHTGLGGAKVLRLRGEVLGLE
jgi:hypothetical protein